MNAELEEVNTIFGAHIPGEMRTFTYADTLETEDENAVRYSMEMLNALSKWLAVPYYMLSLEKGFAVMLLNNIDPKNGHVNPTGYIAEYIKNNILFLQIVKVKQKGAKLTLSRIKCGPGDD